MAEPRGARVSVLVPTYNRARFLPIALESLLAQTRAVDEIIVVNDGSSDETPSVLASFGERIRILNQANAGKSAALNAALKVASGSFVWFFDDDDAALPTALESHLELLERRPEAGFSLSPGLMCDSLKDTGALFPFSHQPLATPFDTRSFLAYLLVSFPSPYHLQGGLVRRECVDATGGFDEDMLRSQDYGFVFQLARRFQVARMLEPTYLHRHGSHSRGKRGLEHAPGERLLHWTQFGRMLWQRWQPVIDLMDHLPRDESWNRLEPTPEHLRDARVARCSALLSRGLWDQLSLELSQAFDGFSTGTNAGRFSSELWVNTAVRLRSNLWEELDGTPAWENLATILRSPSLRHFASLTTHALDIRLEGARSFNDPDLAAQLQRMIGELRAPFSIDGPG